MDDKPTIDYLNKLPVEIWREILFAIPSHPILDASESTDPLIFLHSGSVRGSGIIRVQRQRLALMKVCKTMYPLAEQLLYSKVSLGSRALQNGTFQAAAMAQVVGGSRRRGELTTHMWVTYVYTPFERFDLRITCPNLRSFRDSFGHSPFLSLIRMKNEGWSLGITTLTLENTDFNWESMRIVAVCFPRLTTFSLLDAARNAGDVTQPISFPLLHAVTIHSFVFQVFPFDNLQLPSLKWMRICGIITEDGDYFHAIYRSTSSNLVGLQVDNIPSDAPLQWVPNVVFGSLKQLKTYICPLTQHTPNALLGTLPTHPPHDLENLIFTIQAGTNISYLQHYANYFSSQSLFPCLKRVSLAFSLHDTRTPLLFLDAAKELFSHATVDVVRKY
ncbi:hypothetical protein FRB91_006070 [Serendipita sp. 411]|nr:hypothetical protein FRB91_006070 [Serendipita sp. 411]